MRYLLHTSVLVGCGDHKGLKRGGTLYPSARQPLSLRLLPTLQAIMALLQPVRCLRKLAAAQPVPFPHLPVPTSLPNLYCTQGLAHENQRLQAVVTQLQRELAARDSELAIRADEVASLREAQRGAQSQINQYIADLQVRGEGETCWEACMFGRLLWHVAWSGQSQRIMAAVASRHAMHQQGLQCSCYWHCPPHSLLQAISPSCPVLQAYERQFDSLSRAMHRSDNVAEGLDQERQALLDQLRAAEQASRACACGCAWIRFVHCVGGLTGMRGAFASQQHHARRHAWDPAACMESFATS